MVIAEVEVQIAWRPCGLAYTKCFQFAKVFLPLNVKPKINLLSFSILR